MFKRLGECDVCTCICMYVRCVKVTRKRELCFSGKTKNIYTIHTFRSLSINLRAKFKTRGIYKMLQIDQSNQIKFSIEI